MDMILVKYIHFIGILFLSATLFFEYILVKEKMSNDVFKKVAKIDMYYGLSALVVLVSGLTLWFFVGKEVAVYTQNYLFHIKLTVFIIMGLLSVYPTIFFFKNRKTKEKQIIVPSSIVTLVKIECLLLLLLPLLGILVVNGYGYLN
jgi:putative membrane protein